MIILLHLLICVSGTCGGHRKTLEPVLSFDHVDPRD